MGNEPGRNRWAKRGIVLTIDIALSVMVLIVMIATAYAYFGSPSRATFDAQLVRAYTQDAATIMASRGDLAAPISSQNGTNTTGMREVLRATPGTLCMQVSGYGLSVPDDLTGYWKFDEDTGSVIADWSGNGYSGTITGGASFSENGKSGHSLTLDGETGYADVESLNLHGHSAGTVSLWMKPTTTSGTQYIFNIGGASCDGALYMKIAAGSLVVGYTDRSGGAHTAYSGAYSAPTGFDHIVVTWDPSAEMIRVYKNSASLANYSWTDGLRNPLLEDLRFGFCSASGYYSGSLDEARLYSRALSDAEIRQLYSNPSNLVYVVEKAECAYGGGEVQTLTVPFAVNEDQEENSYYYATFKSWLLGS
jgi:hypothetical protein